MSKANNKTIDANSFFWNSLRRFDTIETLCAGLTDKLEKMKEEHPAAIIDIHTVANLTYMVVAECEDALKVFEKRKHDLAEKTDEKIGL